MPTTQQTNLQGTRERRHFPSFSFPLVKTAGQGDSDQKAEQLGFLRGPVQGSRQLCWAVVSSRVC